jgi:hypothetical protein
MRMRKPFVVLLSLLVAAAMLPGCCKAEPPPKDKGLKDKLNYGSYMYFLSNVGDRSRFRGLYYEQGYKGIVFVDNESECVGYPEDVVVAWPTMSTDMILYNLNSCIEDWKTDLSPYSLSYPITMQDVVERWEDVHALLFSLGDSKFSIITRPSLAYGFDRSQSKYPPYS